MRIAAIRQIHSRDNPDYREWLQLARGRTAGPSGRVLLEGEHLCRAWLDAERRPLEMVIGEHALALAWVRTLWEQCADCRRTVLEDALAAALSSVAHGPAVFFLVDVPESPMPRAITQGCVLLDRVQDPGNLGGLLRTAAAAGLRRAFLTTGCAHAWSPKVLRGAQGAHMALAIHERVDVADFVRRLRIPLAVTALDASRMLFDQDLRLPCAWAFGNEGAGVAPTLLESASLRVRIPQSNAVESLNVAAAAAICLFEQWRQQQHVRNPA